MADVNLSYNEYQALLDNIKALENEKLEHIKLIDDKVGLITIKRSVRGTLDQYAFNDFISNYFFRMSRYPSESEARTIKDITEGLVRALKDLEVKQEYIPIIDVGKEIESLSKSLEEAHLENNALVLENETRKSSLAKCSDYYDIKREKVDLERKVAELTTDSERVDILVKDMQHKLNGYYLMETEYRKVEHYLSEIDTMIAYQKNLEEELDNLKSVILLVSNKVRYSIWGVGKAIKNFLTNNT